MKSLYLAAIILLSVCSPACAQEKTLLLDDYEGPINGGPVGTVDFGAGNGSTVEVTADTEIKKSGSQSLKIDYIAMPGGYIWVSKGYGLPALNSSWLVKPEDINWQKYKAFSFYMYGMGSGATIAFDIRDANDEVWRYLVKDRAKGWMRAVLPFAEFNQRDDWQPSTAVKNNILDFPISSYQYEPRESQGALHFDRVELIEKE
ncbi:MAG: carbohydrate binding domain-containing protein [Candidatus Omnitrophota bacterium]|nr:carbohydrate binding domain-containing protein [Candidatus Omnitrophota bacterium]